MSNFLDNLYTPVTFGNSVLQRDPQNSFASLWRFVLNSTLGIGGLFDPATKVGLDKHEEDLGQSFGYWGAKPGPYLMIPFFGPSDVRDGIGRIGDVGVDVTIIRVDDHLDAVPHVARTV